ncbi:MAG: ATP-binding protein [Spirosomataceae bacterium]
MAKYGCITFLMLFLFFSFDAKAQKVQIDDSPLKVIEQDLLVLNMADTTIFKDEDILAGKLDNRFTRFDKKFIKGKKNFNWFIIELINTASLEDEFYLGSDEYDFLSCWVKKGFIMQGPFKSGQKLPNQTKAVPAVGYSFFKINLKKGESVKIFIKAINIDASILLRFRLPFIIIKNTEFHGSYERPDNFTFMYLGASFLLLFSIFILYVITREKAYFYFFAFITSNLLFIVGLIPYFGIQYFGNTEINGFPIIIFGLMTGIFHNLFCQKLLEIKKYYPNIHLVLNIVLAVFIVSLVTIFIEPLSGLTTILMNLVFAIQYPTILLFCIKMARRKHLPSIMMFISIILFIVGSDITVLQFHQILPPFIYNLSPITISQISCLIGDSIFALIIGVKINEERQLRLGQEKEKQEILARINQSLEGQVKERTQQLTKSLDNLKATQNQLVQSEKLASLGELTAGIAHEIQNPLNFVTNFSELSVGLAQEINEELDKSEPDKEYVKELIGDLSLNQDKINYHGKRASSIVKGMLEHSRASTGVKELTDINKLTDEYLRLSFHGLKAKDNFFNADYELIADKNLPNIEVIPQDIGRVLLNLINNAFYAVNQRKHLSNDENYTPSVSVTTKRLENTIEIRIKDNGTGIPDNIKSKIFQPFFTTKPTGQGTGLGLSLAYDIVTKGHGGTLEVESIEGQGTTFTLTLPVS